MAACHVASLVAFAAFQKADFWTSLALLCLGQQRRLASSSWLVSEAGAAGFGRGESVGMMASLRASIEAVSALLYDFMYRRSAARGRPFDVFVLPAVVVAVSEAQRL